MQIYSEEDRSKMPPELANALSHEREAVENSEIRQQALEAIYMIVLQVNLTFQAIYMISEFTYFMYFACLFQLFRFP
jgi:hypothetical protein